MMEAYPAVILAGGLARRMGGGDKPLRPWGGGTLLDAVVARLHPQAAPVLLNANGDPARFARFGLPVLPDPMEGNPGPLAGVLAAVEWAASQGHAQVLTVPGDSPFLPGNLVARLAAGAAAAGAPVCCACSGGRVHPVTALWSTALGPALRRVLAAGNFRVEPFATAQGLATVSWDATPLDPFLNINTPGDLVDAALAGACPP